MPAIVGRQRRDRPPEETRAAVLDAAEQCFVRFGIQQTTMDDIVDAAGVPRATLYRHAGNRDDILLAVALREVDRLLDNLTSHVATLDDVGDVIVDGTLHAIDLVRSSPILAAGGPPPPPTTAPDVPDAALQQLVERLGRFIDSLFAEGRRGGTLRPGLVTQDAIELLLRTIHSHFSFEIPGQPAQRRREYLRATLLPAFVPDA